MRCLIQIDGSNFYHKVKRTNPKIHLTNFKYRRLVSSLINPKDKATIVYYVGEVKNVRENPKNRQLFANQQKLFNNLQNQNIQIKLGYLLLSDGVYHEKGVDVQIAVDITRGAIKNEYDKCYLISSDTDLLPAIQTAKDEGKQIIYVGFENFISRALSKNCSSYKILKKNQILKFRK